MICFFEAGKILDRFSKCRRFDSQCAEKRSGTIAIMRLEFDRYFVFIGCQRIRDIIGDVKKKAVLFS